MTQPPTPQRPKQGFIAFHAGKHLALEAVTRDEALKIAAKHFGLPARSAHKRIHLEEAPVGPGSNNG